jgi:hypothetical protein
MPVEELMAMLNEPSIVITIEPKGAGKISAFLANIGCVKAKPDNWKDYYFGDVDKAVARAADAAALEPVP